jgi:hypothetical protein
MHELARCVLVAATGPQVTGHVERSGPGMLLVRSQEPDAPLSPGVAVEAHVLDEVRGEVRYGATVYSIEGDLVELGDLMQLSVRQRRGAARVRVHLTCQGAIEARAAQQPSRETVLAVLDISATGVRVLLKEAVHVGTVITLEFPTRDGLVPLRAEVLRTEESRTGWRYGCRLIDLEPRQSELLFRYVLLTQGEQRRRVLERSASPPP